MKQPPCRILLEIAVIIAASWSSYRDSRGSGVGTVPGTVVQHEWGGKSLKNHPQVSL